MSPEHFVEVRTTYGGPAPSETTRALAESRKLLAADRAGWQSRREALAQAESQLKSLSKAL